MKEFKETIEKWYDLYGESFDHDNLVYHLTVLFEDLRGLDLQKSDLKEIGSFLVEKINKKHNNEHIDMLSQLIMANKIKFIFNRVNRGIKEIIDPVLEDTVREISDGDTYINNTSEPDIDLRGIEYDKPEYDEDKMYKTLGIENDR